MQSTNTKGSSPLSTPIFAYVGFSIPKQRITNIVAKAISSTSISIHWDKWVNDPYDIIFGFKIRYIPLSIVSDEENFEEMLATVNNSIVITDLRKYTEYQVFTFFLTTVVLNIPLHIVITFPFCYFVQALFFIVLFFFY